MSRKTPRKASVDPVQVLVGILDVFTTKTMAEVNAAEQEDRDRVHPANLP